MQRGCWFGGGQGQINKVGLRARVAGWEEGLKGHRCNEVYGTRVDRWNIV